VVDQYRDNAVSREVTFEQQPLSIDQGCVRCPYYAPRLNVTSIKFVLALQAATGCVIADIEHGGIVTQADLAELLTESGNHRGLP